MFLIIVYRIVNQKYGCACLCVVLAIFFYQPCVLARSLRHIEIGFNAPFENAVKSAYSVSPMLSNFVQQLKCVIFMCGAIVPPSKKVMCSRCLNLLSSREIK